MASLLIEAEEATIGIVAINVSNMETITGLMEAAQQARKPVIIQVAPIQLEIQGIDYGQFVHMIQLFGRSYDIKCCIHLDHATTVEACMEAVDAGFTSVMYDGSHESLETNILATRKVVAYAHKYGVSVEAELGQVGGQEASESSHIGHLTKPEDVKMFIQETGVDALAVAIGNTHGFYQGIPKLDFSRLEAIHGVTKIPLVLHGGTGIPVEDIRRAIKLGIRKVNFFTEIDGAFMKGFVEAYRDNSGIYMMHAQEKGRQQMIEEIVNKIGWMEP